MKLTERSLAPSVDLTDFVHVVRVNDLSQDPSGSSYKAYVQQLLDLVQPSLYITGGTYNPSTGILELNDNTGGTINISGTYKFEDADNKQNSMTYDGSGFKFPTVDAVNIQVNNIARATVNTGFIDISDSFYMSRPDDFTLRLNPSDKGIIYKSLLDTPPFAPSNAILDIPLTDIPLSSITFTGDGIYVRFIGYTDSASVIYSDTTFQTSPSITQLGILLLKVSGSTVSFLDSVRGIINLPSICKYSNLEIHMLGLQSDVIVRPNASSMTINNSSGSIKGMSVNWQGADNDVKPIASTGVTEFTHLSFLNTQISTPPVFTTAVTTNQYWSGGTLFNLSSSGAASIQRWLVTVNGRITLQYGEAEYPSLDIAKNNVSIATFLDVIPVGTYAEVARMVAIRDTTDLSNTNQAVFFSNGGGGSTGGGSSTTLWGQINGNLSDQTDLQNALNGKQPLLTYPVTGTGTTNTIPKFSGTSALTNSNISDNGSAVTITTDASIRNTPIGRGTDTTNLLFGFGALGTGITSGAINLAIGDYALNSNITGGINNTSIGYASLFSNTTGIENTAVGQYALYSNTTGQYNVALGNSALQYNKTSTQNLAIGAYSLYQLTAGTGGNVGIGISALQKQVNGESNVAIGNNALTNCTTCIRNTAIGTLAMYGRLNIPITGLYNIGIGFQSSRAITTGSNNLVIGLELNDGITTGSNNIVLDPINRPGINTGNSNVVIGGFNGNIPDNSNAIYIGNGAGALRLSFDSAGTMSLSATPVVGTSTDKILVRTSAGQIRQIDNPFSGSVTGATGQVAFFNNSSSLSGSTGFTWSETNKRLTISGSSAGGTGATLDVYALSTGTSVDSVIKGSSSADYASFTINATKAGGLGQANFLLQKNGVNTWQYGCDYGATGLKDFFVYDQTNLNTVFYITPTDELRLGSAGIAGSGGYYNQQKMTIKTNGNVLIGTTADTTERLQVSGTSKFTGDVTITGKNLVSGAGNYFYMSQGSLGNKYISNKPGAGFFAQGIYGSAPNIRWGMGLTTDPTANPTGETITIFDAGNVGIGNVIVNNGVDRLQVSGSVMSTSGFKISGGTSNQFLMANGSVTTGVVTGSGSANSLVKWSSVSAITNSTLLSDNGTNFGIGAGVGTLGTINIMTPSVVGRENVLTAMVSDNAIDKILIANGTTTAGRFAPGFVGYTEGGYGAIFFKGLGNSADDLLANGAMITFLAANTNNPSDPNNGALTIPTQRQLFTFGSNTTYMTMAAGGNLLLQNGTGVDNGVDRLQVSGSVTATGYKVSSGSTTQLLKADGTITVGYRVYTALINQSGTNDPVLTILDNNMGAVITWTRTGAGLYQGLAGSAIFTANKTVVFVTKDINGGFDTNFRGYSPNTNTVMLATTSSVAPIDSVLQNASIEIRVYN